MTTVKNIIAYTFIMLISINTLKGQNGPLAEEYMRIAEDYKKTMNRDSALIYYEKASAEFQALGNIEKLVNAYNQIGIILTRQDKYEKAKTYLEKALSAGLSSLDSNNLVIATTYISLGVVYAAEESYDRSLTYHHKALSIRLLKLGENNPDVATSYGNIGNVYLRGKDLDRSIDAHMKAMKIRENIFGVTSAEIIDSYLGLGNAY